MADKKTYYVHTPVHHDKLYGAGDKIELSEGEATRLLHAKVIGEKPLKVAADEAAIGKVGENPDGAQVSQPFDLEKMTKAELVEFAEGKGFKIDQQLNKADYLAAVKDATK